MVLIAQNLSFFKAVNRAFLKEKQKNPSIRKARLTMFSNNLALLCRLCHKSQFFNAFYLLMISMFFASLVVGI